MRSDMFKVIVERPRLGGSNRKGRSPRSLEDFPAGQGMRRRHCDSKSLNDHLSPLRRYLAKQVDRPWDKVYSEICKNLHTGSAVQDHLRQHVFDYVDVGDPPRTPYGIHWKKMLYVDSRTGQLKRSKNSRHWR